MVIPDAVREFFLSRRALAQAEARSAEAQRRIRRLTDAVDARLALVRAMDHGIHAVPALVVLRDAAALAVAAALEARGAQANDDRAAATSLEDLPGDLAAAGGAFPRDALLRVQELFRSPDPLAFDDLSADDASARCADAEQVVLWLRRGVDGRTGREIHADRVRRLGALALAVAALLTGVLTLARTSDLARGRPVQMSSQRPDCPQGSGPSGLPASGLVDGKVSATFDVCTRSEVRPWAVVDLGEVHPVSRVVVRNRADCCWGQFDLPLAVELSEDGANYAEVARRTAPYTARDPWVARFPKHPARFVRLRVDSGEPRELVLNELEVYAR